ncbi:MAG: hypothetical protein H0W23_07315 [Chloroflexia bacterium]|nr:hypothetical protein [Chloroflexia bacterium]
MSERDGQLVRAAQTFFPDLGETEPVANAPHLLRVASGGEAFVVRRWDADAGETDIERTAEALGLAHATGETRLPTLVPVPGAEPRHALALDGHYYSAAIWLPGRPVSRYGGSRTPEGRTIDLPLPPSSPAEDVILEAVRVVGRFHTSSRPIAARSTTPGQSFHSLMAAHRISWERHRRVIGHHAGSFPEIRRWLRCGNRILPVAGERLEATARAAGDRSVLCHAHLWPVHMLIDGPGPDRVLTGVTGWNQLAAGSPVRDLAQLAVHSSGWSAAVAENILGAYTEVAPLTPEERRLLPVAAALDLVGEVARLLTLAFIDDAMIEHPAQPVLRSGLKTMLSSLENLTTVLAPEEGDKRGGTGWRRNPKGGDGARPTAPGGPRARPAPRSGSGRSRPAPRRGKSTTG